MIEYTDPDGRLWIASEVAKFGTGSRAEGEHYPEVSSATVEFRSGDETRVARNAPLEWSDRRRIDAVFKSAKRD